MSLSTYHLEYGRDVARLHRRRRRRRTRPRAIPLAMITMRKSIHGSPLLFFGYGVPLGGLPPELRYHKKNATTYYPRMSCHLVSQSNQ